LEEMMGRMLLFGTTWLSLVLVLTSGCKSISTKTAKGDELMLSGYRAHKDMRGNDVLSRCKEHLEEANALKRKLLSRKSSDTFLETLNDYNNILVQLDAAASQASLLSQVHPSEHVRKDAETCEQD